MLKHLQGLHAGNPSCTDNGPREAYGFSNPQ